jgi:hypothetical protein
MSVWRQIKKYRLKSDIPLGNHHMHQHNLVHFTKLNSSDEIHQEAALRIGSRPLVFVSLYIFWVTGTADSMGMGPGKSF